MKIGIQDEYNPALALRNIEHIKRGKREMKECIPENLDLGQTYSFLKRGMRNYWLGGECPLLETKGNSVLSKPLASIIIVEVTHFLRDEELYTKRKY